MTSTPVPFARRAILPLQLGIAALGLSIIAFAPPARGAILLLPVSPGASTGLAAAAIDHGALILQPGPVEGSIMVLAEGKTLMGPMARRGVIAVAGSRLRCGDAEAGRPS